MFSKFFYLSSLNSYYTFFLMSKFHVPVRSAQIHLFMFAGAIAAGTIIGGPIGDRIGRKYVIWCSILGVLPFTLALPYANLFWTGILSVVIGVILASAFSAILVYAQELMPGKIGMISGMFFGLAFGMAGVGAALLGNLADHTSIAFVYKFALSCRPSGYSRDSCQIWRPRSSRIPVIAETSTPRPRFCVPSTPHRATARSFVLAALAGQRCGIRRCWCRAMLATFSGKDAGLQSPNARGFRLGDQPRHQLPSYSASSGAFRDIDADLGHSGVNAAARHAAQTQPIPKHRHRTAPQFSAPGKWPASHFSHSGAVCSKVAFRWRCLPDRSRAPPANPGAASAQWSGHIAHLAGPIFPSARRRAR